MKHKSPVLLPLLALAFLAFAAPAAEVQAKIVRASGDGSETMCLLRWMPKDKKYVMVNPKTKAETQIDPSDVLSLVVAKPRDWDNLAQRARGAGAKSALSGLKAIAAEYSMLQYDAEAGRLIADIFIRDGQYEQALKECGDIIRKNPAAAYDSVMAPAYWQALIAAKKTSGLISMLDKGAASRNRTVAAMASLRRGDMYFQDGKYVEALKDGYLRCVYLFPREDAVRAEALYKAAEAFDRRHQSVHGDKMRQRLQSAYPNSEWARKAPGSL